MIGQYTFHITSCPALGASDRNAGDTRLHTPSTARITAYQSLLARNRATPLAATGRATYLLRAETVGLCADAAALVAADLAGLAGDGAALVGYAAGLAVFDDAGGVGWTEDQGTAADALAGFEVAGLGGAGEVGGEDAEREEGEGEVLEKHFVDLWCV